MRQNKFRAFPVLEQLNLHRMKKLPIAVLILSALLSFSFVKKNLSAPVSKPSKPASKSVSKLLSFPVAGKRSYIGSFWGAVRDGGKRKHKGIDIFAKKGTPVVAISDGVIISKGTTPRGGKILWFKPFNYPWTVYYAHLDQHKVKKGQIVKKGQVLGTVGKTGNARYTPAHLHFGIYNWAGAVNPLPYVRNSPKIPLQQLAQQSIAANSKSKAVKQAAAKKAVAAR
jgi:murein DD-endopeptidase MepM/ murein hydrolase activator NlpD